MLAVVGWCWPLLVVDVGRRWPSLDGVGWGWCWLGLVLVGVGVGWGWLLGKAYKANTEDCQKPQPTPTPTHPCPPP